MKVKTLLLAAALTSWTTPLLNAQERGKNFFEKDFVTKQMKEESGKPPAPPVESQPPPVRQGTPEPKQDGGFVSLEPTPAPPAGTPTLPPLERFTPRKALSITAILSADDPELFTRKLSGLSKMAQEKRLVVKRVYVVGNAANIPVGLENLMQQDESGRLLMELGEIEPAPTPPEKYKVTTTPTWIVETEEGEVVLEGAPDLERYFNFSGQFLEPLE